jgi:flavin reductase (DIM6/NTAB) family NADH-FMN oxidoreductase RutF
MDRRFITLDPSSLAISAVYDLLVAAVQPRPIAFVSTVDPEGRPNLAPFSFFMAGGANPPSIAFSSVLSPQGERKHTVRNIEQTQAFVVNTLTRQMTAGMNATSYPFPEGYDEWTVSGFTPIASEAVVAPRVAESPIQLECRLFDIIHHGDQPSAACYVIGEVVRFHVSETIWDGSAIGPGRFNPISRLGGPFYLDLESREVFELPRPTGQPEPSIEA